MMIFPFHGMMVLGLVILLVWLSDEIL